jgi:hypothetical protein
MRLQEAPVSSGALETGHGTYSVHKTAATTKYTEAEQEACHGDGSMMSPVHTAGGKGWGVSLA